jgi:ribose-phosphate pyrophosphokinase
MERAVHPGEVVTAKTRAALLSAIPPACYGNRIFLLDLHAEGIPHYFEGGLTAFHVYAKPIIRAPSSRRLGGDDFVLACTDAGRAKWVESLANDVGVTAAFVFKRRLDGSHTAVSRPRRPGPGQARGHLRRHDPHRLLAARRRPRLPRRRRHQPGRITTHGLFPGDAYAKIKASGLFTDIVCTDRSGRRRRPASTPPRSPSRRRRAR